MHRRATESRIDHSHGSVPVLPADHRAYGADRRQERSADVPYCSGPWMEWAVAICAVSGGDALSSSTRLFGSERLEVRAFERDGDHARVGAGLVNLSSVPERCLVVTDRDLDAIGT